MLNPALHDRGFEFTRGALRGGASAKTIVMESYRRAAAASEDGIFTCLVPEERVMRRVDELQKRVDGGEILPLFGLTFSVKDNLHVAGMATTSNCPGLSISPDESAEAIRRVESAGAVLIGKNTMDQFAAGLNGTRTPGALCRNAVDPDYIAGGSSSGSAVAVARHIVSFSLGSDTGGSGRVPAACNGIIGLKPSLGIVSTSGIVYNSRFFDCIPVFAQRVKDAFEILSVMAGYDATDPFSNPSADHVELFDVAITEKRLAIPRSNQMEFFGDDESKRTYEANLQALNSRGYSLTEIDYEPFKQAGQLVFQSAMVAERLCDYGDVIAKRPETIHPAVWASIEPGLSWSAKDAFKAIYEMKALQRQVSMTLQGFCAFVVPTVPTIFTIDQLLAEPMSRNSAMGTYTYFANPLAFCAVSVPGMRREDGLLSAICFNAPAERDGVLRTIALEFEGAISA